MGFATSVAAQSTTTDNHGQYDRADVERGSRLYAAQCSGCHGANGDMVARVDLRRGQFTAPMSDEDIARVLSAGRPASGMPAFPGLIPTEVAGLVAFIRSGFETSTAAVTVGDPVKGAVVFDGKGECASCHRVNGRGSHRATDLSDIGSLRSPASLQRALMDPASFVIPGNRTMRAVTRDGRTIVGRRMNEDTFTVQLIDDRERLVSLEKSSLRALEKVAETSMPSFATRLSPGELGDLIGYLLSLKGL